MDHSLTIVLFGNSAAVQFQPNNILIGDKQPNIGNVSISRTVSSQLKISGHHVSVINMIGLHETALDLSQLTDRLVNENQIIAFIFVVRLGQLTDEDKMGIEWLQRQFGDQVLQFVMILFTYESEEETDSIIDDLKKNSALETLLKKCSERYHTCSKNMNSQSQMRDLMNRIENQFVHNKQQCYTSEMYNTTLREREHVRASESDDEPRTMKHTTETKSGEKHERKRPEEQNIKDLFRRLHLKDRLEDKLRPVDVLELTKYSIEFHKACAEEDLVHTFLQNLMMMNYKSRYIVRKKDQDFTQQEDNDSSEDQGDIFQQMSLPNKATSESDCIHPMDIQMAVFHCADSFLKQLMVTKLSQCQYALPLLVPDLFTQEIEFPLWTFRQINKTWNMKGSNNEIISKTQPVWKAETPMAFFFRFGSVSSSKSQLMNSLINEKHNTFFHKDCPGSSKTRVLMDGVVEIAWYCPSGKDTDKFTQCVAFCNLHGDAGDNEKQLQILTDMASVNVVILPQFDKSARKIKQLCTDKKPLICLFTEDDSTAKKIMKGKYKIGLKGRNQSDVSEELIKALNDCLSEPVSNFRFDDMSKYPGINEDEEHDKDCKKEKEAAQHMLILLKDKDTTNTTNKQTIKESVLPCQGKLWHQWCEKNKELHRPQGHEIEMETSTKRKQMKVIREEQYKSGINDFMKQYIREINTCAANKKIHFLKWLKILLDEYTSADLSELQHKYEIKWSKVLKSKENNDKFEQQMATNLTDEHAELEKISKELQEATFGLEHIMREIGQIYESCKSENKNKEGLPCHFSSLPSLAADMMISGFPLELMDGDAAHVPVVWVSAVLQELIEKLGNQKVFVLSVLGIQSSGKSTMLNAMFGLQFAVSAGRCTRGAFMQLVKVSEEMKAQLNLDYILVVDTEGLRDLDLVGRSTRHQDNELATFVVGLGNMTLINIFGENPTEIQDILQIVVQAFMRMKKVNLSPSCMFVHQNVSDITAGKKNMEGRRRLLETLDEMTKLAAKDEVCDAECFNDVITFDIQKDVKYFAQLWEGTPPMAPPNPDYCENVKDLKTSIISHAMQSDGMLLIDLKDRINDLWEALLNEQFVFSFRNSLEISAYRKLETEYSKWSWSLRSAMLEIENKLHNKIENEMTDKVEETDLETELKSTSKKVEKSMSEFFKTDTYATVLIQWKKKFELEIKDLQKNIVRETTQKLLEILKQRDLKKEIEAQRTLHLNTLFNKSKELALKLKDKANDKERLKQEFDSFWKQSVNMIITDTKTSVKDIDIIGDMKQLLSKSGPVDAWTDSRDIFSVPSYSDYVQVKKSSGFKANFKKALNAGKEKDGNNLSNEYETQIRTLVNDIDCQTNKKIMSYNIATVGYSKSYIQELADHITCRVTEHQEKTSKYKFKNNFLIDLIYSISQRANKRFTDQHRKFKEANDPVLYVKKKREEYYSIFQKHLSGSTSTAIFGEIICQKLKEPIQQSVYKNTARHLTSEIRENCPLLNERREELEKIILKYLAAIEDFSAYIYYITDPKDFFRSFISDEVSHYITDHFSESVFPKLKENTKFLQKKVIEAAHESTKHVQANSGNVDLWLDHFTKQLSDVLIFSVKDLSGVSRDGVDDFNLLEQVIKEEIHLSDISGELTADQFEQKLYPKDRPAEILGDELCRCCWVQCPFCGSVCNNRIENHPGDHSVSIHRVTGLSGYHCEATMNLCTDFCSNVVTSKKSFRSSGQWIPYKDYRTAGGVYENWKITPDFSELAYWKWFVCRFQKQLEMYYEKSFQENGVISKHWINYEIEDAFESLGDKNIFSENENTWKRKFMIFKYEFLKKFKENV